MRKKDDFGLTFSQYVPYKILSRDLNLFNVQRTPDRPSLTVDPKALEFVREAPMINFRLDIGRRYYLIPE